MKKILVLGIGPGNPDYILPIIFKKIAQCDVLVGGRRHLQLFDAYHKETLLIDRNIERLLAELRDLAGEKQIGIVVSGDPCFYSFLTTLRRSFSREEIKVYPGIGSLQYLFAKGALAWQDAVMTSLHGRRIEDLAKLVAENKKCAFLTDKKFSPREISKYLINCGLTKKRVLVGENLSYPEERIRELTLEECTEIETEELTVMVIYDE